MNFRLIWMFAMLMCSSVLCAQQIRVDDAFTAQQLIEDFLVNSTCITDVKVINFSGGNFEDGSKSYGYFDASGTDFPISEGLILSTGKIQTATEPTSNLADDWPDGWPGDEDLDSSLDVDTYNATVIEFEFVPLVSSISFRYLFASEEFQYDNDVMCRFSDVFGFFIKPKSASNFENIALIPGTDTPVMSTTIHPFISENCPEINEAYFDKFNFDSEIVFDGQTKVLTASAKVNAGETYHIKLVVADDFNGKFDSAVFLEAGSFKPGIDLGPDRLIENNLAIQNGESFTINAFLPNASSYQWSYAGNVLGGETNEELTVNRPGVYSVEVTSNNGCIITGKIVVEYYPEVQINISNLYACIPEAGGEATFNLLESDEQILSPDARAGIEEYFYTIEDALTVTDPIQNPSEFVSKPTTVYASVHDGYGNVYAGEINLLAAEKKLLEPEAIQICREGSSGLTNISFNEITNTFISELASDARLTYFYTEGDANATANAIQGNSISINSESTDIFFRIESEKECYEVSKIQVKLVDLPELAESEQFFTCKDQGDFLLNAGIIGNSSGLSIQWFFEGVELGGNSENLSSSNFGNYEVRVYNSAGCMSNRFIEVLPSEPANIQEIEIFSEGAANTVEVNVLGNGDYEYALGESSNFQESPVFRNIEAGFYTVFVRDKNGCGIAQEKIGVFGYDKFFTPNGDGYFDSWKIKGTYFNYKLFIYDRYGKLLKQLDQNSDGWDGTFNGKEMPEDDYWFELFLDDGTKTGGHFTLIR